MRLAISNLAWTLDQSVEDLDQILQKYNVRDIEIAPSKENYNEILKDRNVVSMQSILFGCNGNIFGTSDEVQKVEECLDRSIEVARQLECSHLVFGCPRNRRMTLDSNRSSEIDFQYSQAVKFFRHICDKHEDVVIGFEPISERYNCNFIKDFREAVKFVKKVNRGNFKVNLDLANIYDSHVTFHEVKRDIKYVSHIHVSETDLSEIRSSEILRKLVEFVKNDEDLSKKLVFSIEAIDLTLEQIDRSLATLMRYFENE